MLQARDDFGRERKTRAVQRRQFSTPLGKRIHALPDSYRRISDGEVLRIGPHDWRVIVGTGHSPEHACLHCPELKLLISGDQVLPRISSNVSVHPTEPDENPMADWLASLAKIKAAVPDDVLVLRNAGPQGGPGMPEWGMLPIPTKLVKAGVKDMLRLSDARMSGTSYGACMLHCASAGGGMCGPPMVYSRSYFQGLQRRQGLQGRHRCGPRGHEKMHRR